MTTEVILTGTGVPHPSPGRAGAGTLVRSGSTAIQFDAGRGTVIRLVEAGTPPSALVALFVTHVHSDHVVDIPDVTMTRWIQNQLTPSAPLPIIAPEGSAARYVRRMLDPFDEDIALRMDHAHQPAPEFALSTFVPTPSPTIVWSSEDDSVTVSAVAVHHEPVDAVAYRIRTPDGTIVISGDTVVCQEVEDLCVEADILVHEACRTTAMAEAIAGSIFETIFSYHADTVPLGAMAQRAGVHHLVLTHLIPPPVTAQDSAAFEQDVRQGGYSGVVTVGSDLTTFTLPADSVESVGSRSPTD
jgi:ribonuclease Z